MWQNAWLRCLTFVFALLLASSAPFDPYDDFTDLQGPYCETIGCCIGRMDHCSVGILGTLCYCDDFCNTTRVPDCCPDFKPFCKDPGQTAKTCKFNSIAIPFNETIKNNCNKCTCERKEGELELSCGKEVCLIEPNIIKAVNEQPLYGWIAFNYSEFWGKTLSEGVERRLGTLKPQRFVLKMNPVRRIYDSNAIPKEFDAAQKWPNYIFGIQDQGWCASSWAISTAAVASDRYAISSDGIEQVQLSAQNLVSCDTNGQQNCEGGHLDRAWSFVKKRGLVDEDCFPYVAKNEKCTIKREGNLTDSGCDLPAYAERKTRYTVGPAYRLGNEDDIMYEIINSGPVQATIKVYHDFFSYGNGVYKHTNLSSNQIQGYHSVRITGWGEEYTINGLKKYWIVANSWGQHWGENGYFRIAKGIDECEIESFVLAALPLLYWQ